MGSVQIYSDMSSMGERVRAGDQVREAGESEHFRGERADPGRGIWAKYILSRVILNFPSILSTVAYCTLN